LRPAAETQKAVTDAALIHTQFVVETPTIVVHTAINVLLGEGVRKTVQLRQELVKLVKLPPQARDIVQLGLEPEPELPQLLSAVQLRLALSTVKLKLNLEERDSP